MEEEYINCFSCGAKSLNLEGSVHPYMLSDPGCYEMFNEVLEKEYSDFNYAKAHHYTVDAYASQHPGEPTNPKAVNSVGVHLVSLYFLFERNMDITLAADIKMDFSQFHKKHKIISPLKKPSSLGDISIFNIWDNENPDRHFELCKEWARCTWNVWKAEHLSMVEQWATEFLKNSSVQNKYS